MGVKEEVEDCNGSGVALSYRNSASTSSPSNSPCGEGDVDIIYADENVGYVKSFDKFAGELDTIEKKEEEK
jgi:hypothetical protein